MEASKKELVRVRLDALAEKHDGLLTPEMVVADAKNPKSPLHEHFVWDTKKAAAQHWLDTARMLIRSVRVVVVTEHSVLSSVAYVRDSSLPGDQQGYRSLASIKSDRDRARETVMAEFLRAEGVMRRAREIAEVLDLSEDVDEIIEKIDTTRQKAQTA
jgi:hypothetical protein